MSEVADLVIDGTLCQLCGCLFDDLIPDEGKELLQSPGYPRVCEECEK